MFNRELKPSAFDPNLFINMGGQGKLYSEGIW